MCLQHCIRLYLALIMDDEVTDGELNNHMDNYEQVSTTTLTTTL